MASQGPTPTFSFFRFSRITAKIACKLLVLIAVFVVILLNRKKEKVGVGPWLAVGLLGMLNIGIAVFWK